MAISPTSICNEALVFLGESQLLEFPESSINSDRCEVFYDRVKKSELKKHPWNFAIKRSNLTRLVSTPENEYTYQFTLPPDLLRILNVYPIGTNWRREGQLLLSDYSTSNIRYIANVDESQFCPEFASMVAAKMAWCLASVLTERAEKRQEAAQWFEDAKSEAKNMDSRESSIDELEPTMAEEVRRGASIPYRWRDVVT